MKIKNLLPIFFVMSLLIMSGCSKGNSDNEVTVVDVHKGSDGVMFDFIKNMPPDKIYAGQEYQIGVKLTNKGAYDVKNGIVKITGDPGYITFDRGILASNNIRNLFGKTNYDPRNSEEVFTFDANIAFGDVGFKEHDSVLIFSTCYDYENVLSAQICVDPDIYDFKPTEKNCKIKTETFTGQGGPVGIASVTPELYIKNDALYPKIKLTIKNFGQGEVFTPGNSQAFCSSDNIDKGSINTIKIRKLEFSDITLDDMNCIPSKDKIVLKDGKADVICTLKDGNPKRISTDTDSYTTSLNVEIEYGYSISKSKTVKVINQN